MYNRNYEIQQCGQSDYYNAYTVLVKNALVL